MLPKPPPPRLFFASLVRPSVPPFFTGFPQFSSGLVGGLAFMFLYFVIYHPRTEQNAVRSAVGQGRNNKDATTDATTTAPGPGSKVVNGGILQDRRFTSKFTGKKFFTGTTW